MILRESLVVSVANIESLDKKIEFNLIFRIFPDVTYVSRMDRWIGWIFWNLEYNYPSFQFQSYVGNDGDEFLFLTNLDAPKHRVIEVNINADNREWDSFAVIVPVSWIDILFSAEFSF